MKSGSGSAALLRPLVLVTVILALSPLATVGTGGSDVRDSADYEYALGGAFTGRLRGECTGLGVEYSKGEPGSQVYQTRAAELVVYETWANYTRALPDSPHPARLRENATQTVKTYSVPAGNVQIDWPDAATVAILPGEGHLASEGGFSVGIEAGGLLLDPTSSRHYIDKVYFPQGEDYELRTSVALLGWGRLIRASDAELTARGDFAFFLKEATVTASGFQFTLPPVDRQSTSTPAAEFVTEHHYHAFLTNEDAEAVLSPTGRPFCGGLNLKVSGTVIAHQARGAVSAFNQNVSFERRVLEMKGDFELQEEPVDADPSQMANAPVQARGVGRITAATVDFAPVPGSGPGMGLGEGLAVAGASAGLALVAWKVLGFFTRLRRDDLMDLDTRRRIYDAIAANPGATSGKLMEMASAAEGTVRYHLRVLMRHGRVRGFRVQREWHFFASEADAERVRADAWLRADPRLGHLRSHLRPEGVPAKSLVSAIRHEFQVSRSGAWKLIRRAEAANLLVKAREGREVMLRPFE